MPEYIINVPQESGGERLDIFLMIFFQKEKTPFSRTAVKNFILQGKVISDRNAVTKPHHKVKPQEEYRVVIDEKKPGEPVREDIPLDIVYEDEDVAVINKQPGLVVHPGAGNREHTLVNALLYHIEQLSDINPDRPGIVHRLDKETSGLLVIAKNNAAHLSLSKQFAEHTIKRRYIALVRGRVEFDEDVIEIPIARHPYMRKKMSVSFSGESRYAKTRYKTIKRTDAFSLLELEPFTGRTHQLRVHLAFLGHPILGDAKYGRDNAFKRLALHACCIGFIHPRTAKYLEFSSDMPQEFKELINK